MTDELEWIWGGRGLEFFGGKIEVRGQKEVSDQLTTSARWYTKVHWSYGFVCILSHLLSYKKYTPHLAIRNTLLNPWKEQGETRTDCQIVDWQIDQLQRTTMTFILSLVQSFDILQRQFQENVSLYILSQLHNKKAEQLNKPNF